MNKESENHRDLRLLIRTRERELEALRSELLDDATEELITLKMSGAPGMPRSQAIELIKQQRAADASQQS